VSNWILLLAGAPEQESQNHCGTTVLQSSVKCLEHKREANEGGQSLFCVAYPLSLDPLILGNTCKLCPISPTILQAAQRRGIAKMYLTIYYYFEA